MRSKTIMRGAVIAAALAGLTFSPAIHAQHKAKDTVPRTSLFSKHKPVPDSMDEKKPALASGKKVKTIDYYTEPQKPLHPTPMTERIYKELAGSQWAHPKVVLMGDIDTTANRYVDTLDTPAHPETDVRMPLDSTTRRLVAGILLDEVRTVRMEERERLIQKRDSISSELKRGKSAATGRRLTSGEKAQRRKELTRLSRGIRGLLAMPKPDARLQTEAQKFADTVATAKTRVIYPRNWEPMGKIHEFGRSHGMPLLPGIMSSSEVVAFSEQGRRSFDTTDYSFDTTDLEYAARSAVWGLLTSPLHRILVLTWRESDYPAGGALSVTATKSWDPDSRTYIPSFRFNTCIQFGLEYGQKFLPQW